MVGSVERFFTRGSIILRGIVERRSRIDIDRRNVGRARVIQPRPGVEHRGGEIGLRAVAARTRAERAWYGEENHGRDERAHERDLRERIARVPPSSTGNSNAGKKMLGVIFLP